MKFCAEYCIEVPDDFPDAELTRFLAIARRMLINPEASPAWKEFAGASNLIGWRFRASSDDWKKYKASIAAVGDGGNHEDNFQRERALFGMFTAGVSCIESTAYELSALVSHPDVLGMPFGKERQRNCSPSALAQWLESYREAGSLNAALVALITSAEWRLWLSLRNRMTHRSNLPRIHSASVGAPPPRSKPLNFAATSSTPGVEAETAEFDALHLWLAQSLTLLLQEGCSVASAA